MNSRCIVILANDPEKSSDLSAMVPVLGMQKTIHLGRAMFFDTLVLCLGISKTDLIIYYYPSSSRERFEHCLRLFAHEERDEELIAKLDMIKLFPQNGRTIMEHISNAYAHMFDLGYKQVAMIGAYCLPLDHHLINAGFLLLNENDIVVGPSFNGRYYLFGMSKRMPQAFNGVQWESNDFYVRLNQNLKDISAKVQELELSYEVYTPEELNQLMLDIERWRSLGDERTAYYTELFLRAIQDESI